MGRGRQRPRHLCHRPAPIQHLLDRRRRNSTVYFDGRAMTAVSYPRSLKPRNEHCIKPGATQVGKIDKHTWGISMSAIRHEYAKHSSNSFDGNLQTRRLSPSHPGLSEIGLTD